MNEPLLVTLLRHGAVAGRANVFRGASDPRLSDDGWAQMRRALAAIDNPPIGAIATSPLARCRMFAESVAAARQLPLAVVAAFAEIRFGDWEELDTEEVRALDPARFAAFRSDPGKVAPPGGEPYAEFAARVRDAFARWTREQHGHVLLITHAGVIQTLVADSLALPTTSLGRVALPPAATCRLSLVDGEPSRLLALNFAV
ncbi:MAG TPA: histidine phosphatase family protein [Burkholderiales bacterium]|nr:histidine phosphatase family protein [Burkholderiales bacterium]